MKASEARSLRLGDFVRASFGCHTKTCEITGINWPTFTLRTQDCRGNEMVRSRHYRSLWDKCEANRLKGVGFPAWIDSQWVNEHGGNWS